MATAPSSPRRGGGWGVSLSYCPQRTPISSGWTFPSSTTSRRYGPLCASISSTAGTICSARLDAPPGHAQRLRHLGELEVRLREVEADREVAAGDALLAPVLADVRLEQPVRPVVADDVLDRQVVPRRRPERLDRVHRAAVAGDGQDRLVAEGRLHPDAARQPDPERAAPGLEELRRPSWAAASASGPARRSAPRRRPPRPRAAAAPAPSSAARSGAGSRRRARGRPQAPSRAARPWRQRPAPAWPARPPSALTESRPSSASAMRRQRQLRIRHQPQVDRVVLGDLVGVQVDVDRAGARRPDARQAPGTPPGRCRSRRPG